MKVEVDTVLFVNQWQLVYQGKILFGFVEKWLIMLFENWESVPIGIGKTRLVVRTDWY
jgi:hypothetical protein